MVSALRVRAGCCAKKSGAILGTSRTERIQDMRPSIHSFVILASLLRIRPRTRVVEIHLDTYMGQMTYLPYLVGNKVSFYSFVVISLDLSNS